MPRMYFEQLYLLGVVHLAHVLVHQLTLADVGRAVVPVRVEAAVARLHGRHFTCANVRLVGLRAAGEAIVSDQG